MNLQPTFTAQLLVKIEERSVDEKLKQIFEWVKAGHISVAVFRSLVKTVLAPDEHMCRVWADTNGFELTYVTSEADLNFIARDGN